MPFHVALPDPSAVSGRVGGYVARSDVLSAVRSASAETGTRFDVLLTSAALESGFNPSAKASSSSASGLFQFTEQTWLGAVRQYGATHGLASEAAAVVRRGDRLAVDDPALRQKILDLRQDPAVAAAMAGDHIRATADQMSSALGHGPDAAELYLGHFLGAGGAAQMLQVAKATPNRPAAEVLPEAAAANAAMFRAKDGTPYTAAQFVQHLRDRVERTYAALGTVMPQGPVEFAGHALPVGQADAPEAGATGWGSALSANSKTLSERLMMDNLAEVFTRVDRGVAQAAKHTDRRQHGLPQGLLGALQAS